MTVLTIVAAFMIAKWLESVLVSWAPRSTRVERALLWTGMMVALGLEITLATTRLSTVPMVVAQVCGCAPFSTLGVTPRPLATMSEV